MAEADPPGVRPLRELEREICELAAHLAAAMCRWLLLVAEFDERGGWESDGTLSCAHWLSWRCSISLRTAHEHLRVARALLNLPLLRNTFANGELSYSKVRALTRVVTPETEAEFVEIARHATGEQLEKLVRGYRSALIASTEQSRRADERRSLTYYFDHDGSLVLEARLPADDGALVLKALEAATEWPAPTHGERSAEHLPEDPPWARRADALVTIARAGLDSGLPERAGGDPVEVVVHVDAATLGTDGIQERCELESGLSLAPETVRRLGCDGSLVRIIERDGKPLSVGRRTRTIPPALRHALRARDRGCTFPGCTHTRFLHAHHVQHWARGGPTRLDNLVQLCSRHHKLVHEGGYQVERAGPAFRFRRPNGNEIPAVPPPTPARGAAPDRQHRTWGLAIDDSTIRPLSAGDHLDYGLAVECLLGQRVAEQGAHQVGREVDLPGGCEQEHRDGDRAGDERGGEQAVPVAPAAGDQPGGERQEQRHQLGQGVRQDAQQDGQRRGVERHRDPAHGEAECVGLEAERKQRRGCDEQHREAAAMLVDPAREAGLAADLERERVARDETGHACHRVEREDEQVAREDLRDVTGVAGAERRLPDRKRPLAGVDCGHEDDQRQQDDGDRKASGEPAAQGAPWTVAPLLEGGAGDLEAVAEGVRGGFAHPVVIGAGAELLQE